MHTVVETPSYLSRARELLGEEAMRAAVDTVSADPEIGDVMQGTGGFRKFRVARPGMGKRGGARVIYIYRGPEYPVFLVQVYAKNVKDNLSAAERKTLKSLADTIFETYGGKL